jgi:capsular exopolysaccharide synthesis family protein
MHVVPPRPLNAVTLLRSLRSNWKKASFYGLIVGALLAAVVWVFLPPTRPSAYTKLRLIPSDQSETIRAPESQIDQRTHKELILSRLVLKKALEMPGIAELETIQERGSIDNAIKLLKREIVVDFPSGPEIIRIRLEGDRDREIGKLVTAVENSYMSEVTGRASAARQERYQEIHAQVTESEKRLKKIRDALENQLKDNSGTKATVEAQQMQFQSEYLSLMSELNNLEREESKTKSSLELLQNRLNSEDRFRIPEATINNFLTTDDEFIELTRKNRELNKMLEDYRKRYEPGSPTIVKIESDLTENQKKLDECRKQARKNLEEQAKDKFDKEARDSIASKQAELKVLANDIATLKLRRDSLKSKVSGRVLLDGKDIDLEQAQEEYASLKRKEAQAKLEITAKQGIEELEPATVEIPNDRDRRVKISALGAIFGFGATLLLFAFLEFRARRLGGIDEIVLDVGMRLIGSLPKCPSKALLEHGLPEKPTASDLRWHTLLTESIDSARTILLHTARASQLKVVLITSAVASEGKSTVARALAQSLARSGRKTLLVDGDLRKPTLHEFFKMPVPPGVCEALRGEVNAEQALIDSPIANLTIMTAGRAERLSIQQLAMDGFGHIINELRDHFDFILIDSSPILPVADTLLMARHADSVLFSMFVNHTQLEKVNSAQHRLAQLDVPIAGAIVNGTREELYGYGNSQYVSMAK